MPTGYTADIEKGITFKEYAYGCARAFGALAHMRDDPHDAEIPQQIEEKDNYYIDAIKRTKAKLKKLRAMSPEDAATYYQESVSKILQEVTDSNKKSDELKKKYEKMLQAAQAYVPPSPEHVDFQCFMVSQITDSIEFDCHYRELPDDLPDSATEWLDQEIKGYEKDLIYYNEKAGEDTNRMSKRNQWLQLLHESLK